MKLIPIQLLTALLLCSCALVSRAAGTSAEKPNIIFVLADDYGVAEASCYGADNYKTPNIDALARSGIRYTHAYTVPLCGPSRAAIMTGRYAFRTGAVNQDRTGLIKPGEEIFVPRVLKPAGYISSVIGKWGQLPQGPAEFGFDDYLKFTGSGTYWNTQPRGKTYLLNGETRPLRDKEYMPDVMHKHLVDFISAHKAQPFFVYYSLSHVHSDILPTPDSAPDSKDTYTENIVYMDKLVGKLLQELERLKLRDKTLVMFMGDNGTATARAPRATIGGRPLSGSKGSMLEGGGLVPLIASWPGIVPAGKVSAEFVDATDLLPTFAELAGAKLPEGRVIDGRSFAAQLKGDPKPHRQWIFDQLARMWFVREEGWKLNEKGELFDMSDAPFAEKLVGADTNDPAAQAARRRMQAVLDQLNPAGGILDDGDGSGRHAKHRKKGKNAAKQGGP